MIQVVLKEATNAANMAYYWGLENTKEWKDYQEKLEKLSKERKGKNEK